MAILNLVRICAFNVYHQNMFRLVLRTPFGAVHSKSTFVDALDIFTSEILSKKNKIQTENDACDDKDRSKLLRKVASETNIKNDSDEALGIEKWNETEIDNYITVTMECSDRKTFSGIVEQIIRSKRLPSEEVILQMLCYLCDDSDNSMATISDLIDVCQEKNLAFYAKNVNFAPFLSQYLWKIERFDDALRTLNTIFGTTNETAKSLILRNYRQITYDAVKNKNESVLDLVISNAGRINDRYNDPVLISYVWIDCFFSELFKKQTIASEMFTTYDIVQRIVTKDIGWIILSLLQQHNVDAIHRLIELCLAATMKREVGICLTALFDYQCKFGRTIVFEYAFYKYILLFRLAT